MKAKFYLLSIILILSTSVSFAQKPQEFKAGHVFYISLPPYMTKTKGLNNSATIEFKSAVKDVYGFVIEDNKEELRMVELNYSSINEFTEEFLKDFATGESKINISKTIYQTKGGINFAESDVVLYSEEAQVEIYYLVGVVETKDAFYKVLSWSSVENKDKFKADFQNILYSLRD